MMKTNINPAIQEIKNINVVIKAFQKRKDCDDLAKKLASLKTIVKEKRQMLKAQVQ